MGRQVIRGETIPLERIADEFKSRARMVAARALELSMEPPEDVAQVLAEPPENFYPMQLRLKLTYKELDRWAEGESAKLEGL